MIPNRPIADALAEGHAVEVHFATHQKAEELTAQGFDVNSIRRGGSGWRQYLMFRVTKKEEQCEKSSEI